MPGPISFQKKIPPRLINKFTHCKGPYLHTAILKKKTKNAHRKALFFFAIFFGCLERNPTEPKKSTKKNTPRPSVGEVSARTGLFARSPFCEGSTCTTAHPTVSSTSADHCFYFLFFLLGGIDSHHSTPHREQHQRLLFLFLFLLFFIVFPLF